MVLGRPADSGKSEEKQETPPPRFLTSYKEKLVPQTQEATASGFNILNCEPTSSST
jgi:hypothetical protein